jgi:hypothetical protein
MDATRADINNIFNVYRWNADAKLKAGKFVDK